MRLVTAVLLAVLLAGPVYADLATSLTNGDLDSPVLGFDTIANDIQDWNEILVGTNDKDMHFDQTAWGSRVVASTGTQFGVQIFETGGNTGDIVGDAQSLGTVAAGDVGKTLLLTADGYCEPKTWIDGEPLGFQSEFNGDMQVSFRSGTTATSLGTLMGTAGPVNSYDSTDNIFDYADPVALLLADWNLGTASYTVVAGDVGTEIFAMVASTLTSIEADPGGQGQAFCWDTAILTPEPATLAVLALGGLAALLRRRR